MSEPKEEDFSKLPIEERLSHKAWKARMDGYKSLILEFENSRGDTDLCFDLLDRNPDLCRIFVVDTNVIAQESGVLAVAKYLQLGGSSDRVEKLKQTPLLRSLCEKGLSSSRAGTKANTVEVVLLLTEITGSGDWILETVISFFDNKLPKLVASCVNCTFQMLENFGCSIVPPKSIIPFLAKLFTHADRNVRSETTKLAVEIYKWIGDALIPLLFDNLKQVQQRELNVEFEKVKGVKPVQTRLTRAQQESAHIQVQNQNNRDSDMEIVHESELQPAFDPFEMLDPVDVLSKMPHNYNSKLASPKWQDRKEALEELNELLKKAPKLANGDYSDLVRSLAKAFKDANIQVVQLAANAVEYLSKGLHEEFRKYQALVFSPMSERTKEKKPLVSQALFNAMFSIFEFSSLQDILDDTLAGLRHKTPQIKISSLNYLVMCLALSKAVPKPSQVDQIMEIGVKLLSDPQESVRQASTELIGTLMKIVGEQNLKKLLANVDDNRLAKVKAVYEKAEVAVTKLYSSTSNVPSSLPVKTPSAIPTRSSVVPSPKMRSLPLTKAIPTKRSATSPARRDDISAKALPKNFTGRPLLLSKPILDIPRTTTNKAVSPENQEEMLLLKKENAILQSRYEQLMATSTAKDGEMHLLKRDNEILRDKIQQLENDVSERNSAVRQKDLNVARLTSELHNAQDKIKSLEQKIELSKHQQTSSLTISLPPPMVSESSRFSPFRSPERLTKLRVSPNELSSRVDRLSIEGALPTSKDATASSSKRDFDFTGEEDSWRRAAEVTAELKARIEKMKQRNKMSLRP